MLRQFAQTALVLMFAVLLLRSAAAQTRATTADLTGVVYDQAHLVMPAATVTAISPESNQARSATTGTDGRFTIPALPPGVYDVTVEQAGFTAQQSRVDLQLGTLVTLEFVLKIAPVAEAVTIIATTPVIDRAQTAVAAVITQPQINNLPTNGRDFLSFAVMTPAVARDNTPQQGAAATSGLTVAGQRARSNNITVDGLDNNDIVLGSVRATFSQEAVREFEVIANSYSAEFGKASGGVVNIVTKSGANTPTGNLFWFGRDSALNSKDYFEQFTPAGDPITRDKAPYNQKQFGGIFGGPLQRDRTFLFGSFERLDIHTNNFVTIDDTTLLTLFGQPIGTAADVLRRAGFPVDIGNVPYQVESDQVLIKIDHRISPTQQAVLRYNFADGLNENIEPWGGLVAKSRGAALNNTDHMIAGAHTTVLQSAFVNELRAQFARRDQRVDSLDPNCGGPCTSETQGGPTVEVLGVASVGRQRFTPQPRLTNRYQILDTLSAPRGHHNWKAGVDFNIVDHARQALPLHFGGRYLFQSLPAIPGVLPSPISGIQALAAGLPAAYIQGYGNSTTSYGYSDVSLFAQDDWRPLPDLTVKAGVRYQNQFWPGTTFTTPGVPGPYSFPRDNDNVAPRLAISWVPTADKKTVVHGAYGIYYDNIITGVWGIADIVAGSASSVRTLVRRFPSTLAAWNSPGHQLPESAAGTFPSLVIAVDPGMKTPYAHHVSAGIDQELQHEILFVADYVYARGFNQPGTIDYNPIVPALGVGRRPLDVAGQPGTSSSVLQYTSFGETWYHGLTVSLRKRFSQRTQFMASYTFSKAEDNSTDFQTAFIAQNNGFGRNPSDPTGLPLGFDPESERGPSLQDQPHRFVMSGVYVAPWQITLSAIVEVASGHPFNVLAGADLNGDGDGGTIPGPDRARTNPADPSSSIGRNSGRLPMQSSVDIRAAKHVGLGGRRSLDLMAEVFNLFNRANFVDVNNIFGTGAYPTNPLPTYGQFERANPPRQVQLAAKFNF